MSQPKSLDGGSLTCTLIAMFLITIDLLDNGTFSLDAHINLSQPQASSSRFLAHASCGLHPQGTYKASI